MPRDSLLSVGGVARTRALRTYGSMAKDSNLEKQTSLHSSVLAWEFDAEPEPATHFSKLSTSLCLHCPLSSHTENTQYLPNSSSTSPLVFYISNSLD